VPDKNFEAVAAALLGGHRLPISHYSRVRDDGLLEGPPEEHLALAGR